MKPLHIFIFLFSLTVLSCVKTNNEDIDPNATNIADYSTLIIGTWQLKDIGTKQCSSTCFLKTTLWTKSSTNTILDFKVTGTFTKDLLTDRSCTGSFKITTDGRLMSQSECTIEENITYLTNTELVLDAPNRKTCYRYVKQ